MCVTKAPVHAQVWLGARGVALGNATTAIPGYNWSVFGNPALLNNHEKTIGFYGVRNYGFAELIDVSVFATVPTKWGVSGVGMHRYGDANYNETRIRLGYKNEWQHLHIGAVLNYTHIAFGGVYGSGGALGIDIGLAAELTPDLWLGAKTSNINQPAYHFETEEEYLYRDMSIGLSYALAERALFSLDMVKDVRFPVSWRSGIEVEMVEKVVGRIGITTEPVTLAIGMGISGDVWEVNLAVQRHEILGLSPGIDLIVKL